MSFTQPHSALGHPKFRDLYFIPGKGMQRLGNPKVDGLMCHWAEDELSLYFTLLRLCFLRSTTKQTHALSSKNGNNLPWKNFS